jgi:hypothetical protein
VCAGGAAVLCIIGLAGGAPLWLTAIATIILGVALLVEGGGLVTQHRRYFSQSSEAVADVGRTSSESIAGIAGIVLGILSLIGLAPHVLLPVSLIVFGGGLLMGMSPELRGGLSGTGHALVGCGGVVLGILALVGVYPVVLTLIGLLAVSGALLLSSIAMGARIRGPHHHVPVQNVG